MRSRETLSGVGERLLGFGEDGLSILRHGLAPSAHSLTSAAVPPPLRPYRSDASGSSRPDLAVDPRLRIPAVASDWSVGTSRVNSDVRPARPVGVARAIIAERRTANPVTCPGVPGHIGKPDEAAAYECSSCGTFVPTNTRG